MLDEAAHVADRRGPAHRPDAARVRAARLPHAPRRQGALARPAAARGVGLGVPRRDQDGRHAREAAARQARGRRRATRRSSRRCAATATASARPRRRRAQRTAEPAWRTHARCDSRLVGARRLVAAIALRAAERHLPLFAACRRRSSPSLGWLVGRVARALASSRRSSVSARRRASFAAGNHSVARRDRGTARDAHHRRVVQPDGRPGRLGASTSSSVEERRKTQFVSRREPRAAHSAHRDPRRRRDAARRRRRPRRPAALPVDDRARGRAARHGSPTTCSRCSASRAPPASCR